MVRFILVLDWEVGWVFGVDVKVGNGVFIGIVGKFWGEKIFN